MRTVHVHEDPAQELAVRVAEVLASGNPTSVALSGGSTPRRLYRLLATEYRDRIPWDRVSLFQVDERWVEPDDPDSNWRMIREELVDRVPGVTAHPVPHRDPRAAERYEETLRSALPRNDAGIPVFDLVLLGMGADGHTASLFPGTAALEERDRLVVVNEVPQLDTRRITLTYPVIEAARRRWFLVAGPDKAEPLARVLEGEFPAGRVVPAEFYVDPAAGTGPSAG